MAHLVKLQKRFILKIFLWNAVKDFINFFSFIKLWYENNTFFGFITLSFPEIKFSSFK